MTPGNDTDGGPGSKIAPLPRRIGIFRRVAVERYSQPLESNQPELLAPWRAVAKALGLGLFWVGLGIAVFTLALF